MKSIGNIYLAWRKDAKSPRILVGIVKKNATEGVRFYYLADGAIEARKLGFDTYRGFPDVTEVYTENVLKIFGHRILQAAGTDIEAYFDFWDIDRAFKSKPFYMLAYTQGILPNDNFEFLASFNPQKNFTLVTEVQQLTQHNKELGTLDEGDILRYEIKHNGEVVNLYKGDRALGIVKEVHSRIFTKAKNLIVNVHKVEQSQDIDKVFIRISRE